MEQKQGEFTVIEHCMENVFFVGQNQEMSLHFTTCGFIVLKSVGFLNRFVVNCQK